MCDKPIDKTERREGEGYDWGLNPTPLVRRGFWGTSQEFLYNLCLWECISSHFEAHFPYSITLILSKVRHINTLFLTISFACSWCIGKVPMWGGGTAIAMHVWVSPMFWKTAEPRWGGGWGLKIWKKAGKTIKSTPKKKLGICFPVFCTFSFTPTQ